MLVCHCHAITDRDLRKSIRAGASSIEQVGLSCGAATGCGGCRDLVQHIIDDERRHLTMAPAVCSAESRDGSVAA